jgi:hypothetical protein
MSRGSSYAGVEKCGLRHGMEARRAETPEVAIGGSVHDSPAAGGGSLEKLLEWWKGLTPRRRSPSVRLLLNCCGAAKACSLETSVGDIRFWALSRGRSR